MSDPPLGRRGLAAEKQQSFLLSALRLACGMAGKEQEQSPGRYSLQYSQSRTREI